MSKKRRYSAELKKEAVDLVQVSGMSVANAASDLGVGYSTLIKWLSLAKERNNDPSGVTEAEREELKRLRKENHVLKLERDLLKKTALYFAKDSK